MRGMWRLITMLALPAVLCGGGLRAAGRGESLILATTTSVYDSGLLEFLLARFEPAFGIRVKALAVGTGEALAMGRRGDADVLIVHDPAAEQAFMDGGHGERRLGVMHNYFVLVGPPADPAGARGLPVERALRKIAASRALFVSRGDRSGTHSRELALWRAAGVDGPSVLGERYVSTGQGMGATARIASEKQAYTLIDQGTFLALGKTLELVRISPPGPLLRNRYSVIVVRGSGEHPERVAAARRFAEWLTGPECQKLIAGFGVERFGEPLFLPGSGGAEGDGRPAGHGAAPIDH